MCCSFALISAHTSSKFDTKSNGIPSSTSMACFMVFSVVSISLSIADGTILNLHFISALKTPEIVFFITNIGFNNECGISRSSLSFDFVLILLKNAYLKIYLILNLRSPTHNAGGLIIWLLTKTSEGRKGTF